MTTTYDPPTVLPADYLTWLRGLAAERRFGDGDRLGTVNLVDDAARARDAIRTGTPVSLARPPRPSPSQRGDGRPGRHRDRHPGRARRRAGGAGHRLARPAVTL